MAIRSRGVLIASPDEPQEAHPDRLPLADPGPGEQEEPPAPGQGQRDLHLALARFYDQDAVDRARRPVPEERVRRRGLFVAQLRSEGRHRVLDVGLGPGLDAVAMQGAGLLVSGVDLSSEHVRLARAAGIDAHVAPAQRLPFPDASFDALWCTSVLMHMPDPDLHRALGECARVLVRGGLAAFGTWGGDGTIGTHPDDTFDPPRYFNWRTDQAMRRAISQHARIEDFDTWSAHGPTGRVLRYQWCLARFGQVP